ncbi:carboxypeptidase regulatory-like domain-containing protein [Granulicella sp. dw_53]|uniref:carboxypeptidase regulatory-like domain-containing protein n=1 Tax=Granulicella sp. dw_53 TaxID=2719792 RepID=UPI0021070E34|nr:carboxypeptidase regulatory-like domain-containing protein [Granulicella sp. dw_53]
MTLGCSNAPKNVPSTGPAPQPAPSFYKVDPATAGSLTGTIKFSGKKPSPKLIDMREDPACVEAHHGKAYDQSLVVSSNGSVANAFVYIKAGLEGKNFEAPKSPVTIDQSGCWFRPGVLGIQTNQTLQVTNSDPVTHNIHPMAEVNREWNHSQGPGDAPLSRHFIKPEIMIRVKCNIHSWMHAFIGVLPHPYFDVSRDDGSFEIKNLPAGTYSIAVWQENLGTQEQQITVTPHTNTSANFTFKGK